MNIIKMNQVTRTEHGQPFFTGVAYGQDLVMPPISKNLQIYLVSFNKGVRNKFHSHTSEQVLIVTAGRGIVTTEAEQQVVEPGDIILFPAGEKHWHGATKDSDFSHIGISLSGTKSTQLET